MSSYKKFSEDASTCESELPKELRREIATNLDEFNLVSCIARIIRKSAEGTFFELPASPAELEPLVLIELFAHVCAKVPANERQYIEELLEGSHGEERLHIMHAIIQCYHVLTPYLVAKLSELPSHWLELPLSDNGRALSIKIRERLAEFAADLAAHPAYSTEALALEAEILATTLASKGLLIPVLEKMKNNL